LIFAARFQPAGSALEKRVVLVEGGCDFESPLDIWKFIPVELVWLQQESGFFPTVEVYGHSSWWMDGARESASRFGLKQN
jgi:hypothetical protein